LSELVWDPSQLNHLDLPFTEEEIKCVIMSAPKKKAPGLDDFIGSFFSSYWEVIKEDILSAVHQFYQMN
jgi:hypothetical protein